MATKGFANLLEQGNTFSAPYTSQMPGLPSTRLAGFLWICSTLCKGPGYYFSLDEKVGKIKQLKQEDDPFDLELKPSEIILKSPTGDESIWKLPLQAKDFQDCFDAIMEVAGALPKSNLNARLEVKGKVGVWASGTYDRGPIKVTLNEILKSGPLGGKAGGNPARTAPTTAQQEQVTLEIFHILVKGTGTHYDARGKKNYQKMFDKLCTGYDEKGNKANINYGHGKPLSFYWAGLGPADEREDHPTDNGIPSAKWDNKFFEKSKFDNKKMREWYYHFLLQFRDVEQFLFKTLQTEYTVYSYTQFMNFITGLITSGPLPDEAKAGVDTSYNLTQESKRTKVWPTMGRVSQKDSWNPADVWLVDSRKINKKMPRVPGLIAGKVSYLVALKCASTVAEVNMILNIAFHRKVIMGISLKKSSGSLGSGGPTFKMSNFASKRLHIEYVNLTTSLTSTSDYQHIIYPLKFNGWNLNLAWDKSGLEFKGNSNTMHVIEIGGENQQATMRIGSGGQSGPHNINLEYAQKGAAAQLGKIPKNLLRATMAKLPGLNVKLPSVEEALESIPINKDNKSELVRKINSDKTARKRQQEPELNRTGKYASAEDYRLALLKYLDSEKINAYFGDDHIASPKYYGNKDTLYVPSSNVRAVRALLAKAKSTDPPKSKMAKVPEVREIVSNRDKYLNMKSKTNSIKEFSVPMPKRVGGIAAKFDVNTQDLNDFVDRVMIARNNPKWKTNAKYRMNITMNVQIMEWAYDICQIESKGTAKLNNFLNDTYYMSQKKGKVPGKDVMFGPFVKLS
jgi:hypothetical protein